MGSLEYLEIFVAIICFFITCYLTRDGLRWNWPFLGMLPKLLVHLHRIHDRFVDVLQISNCTFKFKGPWFAHMDAIVTVDPANVQYIMITNFSNYPKGDEFRRIFDILGDGIFNSDGESWRVQRRMTQSLINHRSFMQYLVDVTHDKVEKGLVPVLQHAFTNDLVLDLQYVFQRLTFDTTCLLLTGHDPGCLSIEFPDVPFAKALVDAEMAIAMRHAIPETIWKVQRRLGIGHERLLSEAWKVLDRFIDEVISMKRKELELGGGGAGDGVGVDLLTTLLKDEKQDAGGVDTPSDKFLRDTVLTLMVAGQDAMSSSLTWFIWLVATHPEVEEKIRVELRGNMIKNGDVKKWHVFRADETNKLTYLHAAICELLRLFPPLAVQHKSPLKADTLPSGHYVTPKMKIVLSLYAMGRMKVIWGDDCFEFKPERWITEQGNIKYEPPYKFFSFNAGPRTCLGKDVAFTQIKMVAATLIHNYGFKVVDGERSGEPDASVVLHMKHGLKVKVSNRWSSV